MGVAVTRVPDGGSAHDGKRLMPGEWRAAEAGSTTRTTGSENEGRSKAPLAQNYNDRPGTTGFSAYGGEGGTRE
jgi:hypothetical protein